MSNPAKISFFGGLSLAVGSIIGSGVLFLPAMTTALSQYDVLWVWAISIIFCVPLVYIFVDIIAHNPNASGLSNIIEAGLGKACQPLIPYLFLGTVCFGMPTAAFIVGQYVTQFLHASGLIQYITALAIITIGLLVNLSGIKTGQKLQMLLSFMLLITAALLIMFTYHQASPHYFHLLDPHKNLISLSNFSAIVVAFWAYAGFENLTFMSGEFLNFKKDFHKCIIIGLILCGICYAGLSSNYAAIVPKQDINIQLGLYQLSQYTRIALFPMIITLFAFIAVQINFNSWIWGISRLIHSSANDNQLPHFLAMKASNNIPKNAAITLCLAFYIVTTVLYFFPKITHFFLLLVSTNFVYIYILCLLSYIRSRPLSFLKVIAIILTLFLIIAIISSKLLTLYPIFITCLSIASFYWRKRQSQL